MTNLIECPIVAAAKNSSDKISLLGPNVNCTFDGVKNAVNNVYIDFNLESIASAEPVLVLVDKSWQSLVVLLAVMRSNAMAIPVDNASPKARIEKLKCLFSIKFCLDYRDVYANKTLNFQKSNNSVDGFLNSNKPCLGIFTSGSSGTPKLVVHSWGNLLNQTEGCNQLIPLLAGDRTLLSLPLYHIGGIAQALRAIVSCTTLVIAGAVEQDGLLSQWSITHTSMVSTQLQRVLAKPERKHNIKAVLLGGGPSDAVLIKQAKVAGYPIWQTYGMTETASQLITESPSGEQTVIKDAKLKIADNGELLVNGKNIMLGYWVDGKVHPARDDNGWFHTRDLVANVNGKLEIVGRLDNQFISGGKNIQPEEVEKHLLAITHIEAAIVVPVPHHEYGQASFAFLRLSEKVTLDDAFILLTIAQLKSKLPGYLVPRLYGALPDKNSFEKNGGLKINRKALLSLALKIQQEKTL